MSHKAWNDVPASIEAGLEERQEVLEHITRIQAELSARRVYTSGMRGSRGLPMTREDWEAWRQRAKTAMGHHQRRQAFLKAWVKTQRREALRQSVAGTFDMTVYDLSTDEGLLRASYKGMTMLLSMIPWQQHPEEVKDLLTVLGDRTHKR